VVSATDVYAPFSLSKAEKETGKVHISSLNGSEVVGTSEGGGIVAKELTSRAKFSGELSPPTM